MYICLFLLRRHTYNIIIPKSTDVMTRDRVGREKLTTQIRYSSGVLLNQVILVITGQQPVKHTPHLQQTKNNRTHLKNYSEPTLFFSLTSHFICRFLEAAVFFFIFFLRNTIYFKLDILRQVNGRVIEKVLFGKKENDVERRSEPTKCRKKNAVLITQNVSFCFSLKKKSICLPGFTRLSIILYSPFLMCLC